MDVPGRRNKKALIAQGLSLFIHRQAALMPRKFFAVAGLPQVAGEPMEGAFPELERVHKLGFKGVLLNPDPYENSGTEAPGLGKRYWCPSYEKLCELDMPAHIHALLVEIDVKHQ